MCAKGHGLFLLDIDTKHLCMWRKRLHRCWTCCRDEKLSVACNTQTCKVQWIPFMNFFRPSLPKEKKHFLFVRRAWVDLSSMVGQSSQKDGRRERGQVLNNKQRQLSCLSKWIDIPFRLGDLWMIQVKQRLKLALSPNMPVWRSRLVYQTSLENVCSPVRLFTGVS